MPRVRQSPMGPDCDAVMHNRILVLLPALSSSVPSGTLAPAEYADQRSKQLKQGVSAGYRLPGPGQTVLSILYMIYDKRSLSLCQSSSTRPLPLSFKRVEDNWHSDLEWF